MQPQDYLKRLQKQFQEHSDLELARGQEAYMRNQFDFHGIKTTARRELQKTFLKKEDLPLRDDLLAIVKNLWEKPQREYQYFAQELFFRFKRELQPQEITVFEYMITHRSWWDTVDFIAANLVGQYFRKFPEQRAEYVERWLATGNIWLQRTAVIFQLKYKKETDTKLLASTIDRLLGSREFFINKAIGWALREYSKTDPQWVVDFVEQTELSRLSRVEGLKWLNRSAR